MKKCDNKSVGLLVWRGGKLLLIERKKFPFGFAPPAGHVDDHGSFERAARAELKEEVGLDAENLILIVEGRKENKCRREGGDWHYWMIYEAQASGSVDRSLDETKQVGWFNKVEIKNLALRTEMYNKGDVPEEEWEKSPGLEQVWFEWFKEVGII